MTALAKDTDIRNKGDVTFVDWLVGASQTIYKGALVMIDPATGYLIVGADTAACLAVGIADESLVSTTAGVKKCRVVSGGIFLLPSSTIALTDVPDSVEILDSGTVSLAAGTSNHCKCGKLVTFVTTTSAWIYIPPVIDAVF